MGLQELMLLMILLIFFFCSPASFASISKNLDPEKRENKGVNGINKTNTTFGGSGVMANKTKYTTSLKRVGGGGRSGGDGSQLNPSPQGGGNGLVPVYAAGAAGNRINHKGGATTYTPCWKGELALLVATLVYLLLYVTI